VTGPVCGHGAIGRDKALRDDLTAKDALAFFFIRALAAEKVSFEPLDIEQGQQIAYRISHCCLPPIVHCSRYRTSPQMQTLPV
jgi:hypothetical protein